ncbi:hypothetical protein ES705_13504 [subsurface metagenome]
MRKFSHLILTLVICSVINVQLISAQFIFDKETKADKSINAIINTTSEFAFPGTLIKTNPAVITTDRSLSCKNSLYCRQLQIITQAEIEEELELENWMTELNDGSWVTDTEECMQMENWMFNPCKWIDAD